MWEFTEHRYLDEPRWTWMRLSERGRILQKSDRAFRTYVNACAHAAVHGFDSAADEHRLVELA